MGITQNTGASSIIRPGVIDNTAARPASPYEGQVIFQKDTDQLLVWNGTAWVIPNSPAQNPQGLELITTGTASTSDFKINNVFSSIYDNYKIIFSNFTTSAIRTTAMQLLNGSNVVGNNYNYGAFYVTWTSANGAFGSAAQAYWNIATTATNDSGCIVEIQKPFIADSTTYQCQSANFDAHLVVSGNNTNATSCDGFRITNLTGDTNTFTYSVYGYRK